MTHRSNTDNLFALILVLMISLITNPVFGMSSHQANMVATSSASHHQMMMSSENCHHAEQQLAEPMTNCPSQANMSFCSDCDPTHCQPYSSDLPIGMGAITDIPQDRQIPQLASAQPISRTENLFRPPIQ